MFLFKNLHVTLLAFIYLEVGHGKDWLEHLYRLEERPKYEDIVDAFAGKIPDVNPLGRSENYSDIKKEGPKFIAALEGSFRGGTFAFLGRDAFFAYDIMRAYYATIGQAHRVTALHASTATVHWLNASRQMLDFLKSNGLSESSVPFVIVDRTSFRDQSQSRMIFRSAQRYLSRVESTTPKPLRVAVASSAKGCTYKEFKDCSRSSNPLYIQELANFTDNAYWTDTYSEDLEANEAGNWIGVPTQALSRDDRESTIQLMIDVIHAVSNPKFHERVVKEAGKLGYRFPYTLKKNPFTVQKSSGTCKRIFSR